MHCEIQTSGWEKVACRVTRTAKTLLRIDGKENIPGKWSNNLLILHSSILLPKKKRKDTRLGTNGDSLIHSVLWTFTKCISCFVKERKHLPSWSFQFRHRIDKKACNSCDSCPQIVWGTRVTWWRRVGVWWPCEEGRSTDTVTSVWERWEWEMRLQG